MPFKENDPNTKKGGRKLGSQNKVSKEIRENFNLLVTENMDGMREALTKLKRSSSERYINALLQLAPYCVPKLQPNTIIEKESPRTFTVNFDYGEEIKG